jgi:GNAT superfamily N-acetyltransferase
MPDNVCIRVSLTGDTDNGIKVHILSVTSWRTEEIHALYRSGGWWQAHHLTPDIPRIMEGSYAFVVAVDAASGKAIGMGRVLSDGISDAYIQDLIVFEEYRRMGIGRKILQRLIDICATARIDWIGLVAEAGTAEFYADMGFVPMEGHTPMQFQRSA